jgi:biotin carboxyl carrier protein
VGACGPAELDRKGIVEMPDYDALVDGKTRKIELTRISPNSFSAKVDGKPRRVRLQTDGTMVGKPVLLEIDGKRYRVELPEVERGRSIRVKVEEAVFDVGIRIASRAQALMSVESPPQATMKKAGANRGVAIEGAISAPMTGKVVKVNVKKGDQVKAGQVLCVIEAMKMENEISAPRAGTVQEVNVAEGASVNEGGTLFVIA